MMRRYSFSRWHLLLMPLSLVFLLPLVQMLLASFTSNADINRFPPRFFPSALHISGYVRLFRDAPVARWMLNSAIVSGIAIVSHLILCSLGGYAYARLSFRGRTVAFVTLVATIMIPTQMLMIPTYFMFSHLGLIDTLGAAFVPFLTSAFGVFLMRQYIVSSVPNELIDASRVDGCHTLRVFWHVVLPAVRPAAAVLGLLTFMNAWNDFFWPLIVLTPGNPTVQVAVSTLQSGYVQDYSLVFAGTFVSILPLLVIFLVLGRQIIGGIMKGAVKG